MTEPKFGYKNYADLARNPLNAEILAHASTTYDTWTKYVLKHDQCPTAITYKWATSPVWYHRIAAVMPKNKFKKFGSLIATDSDKRVAKYYSNGIATNWGS